MKHMNLKRKQITSAVNSALASGFQINTQNDAQHLQEESYFWDDLTKLKDDLGQSVVEFVSQVNAIVLNPMIIQNLGDKKAHFERVTQVFFSDVANFSSKVKEVREQHEGKTGKVGDLNEYNLYNRLAITYHSLFMELQTLVTPTLGDIVLTVSSLNIPGVAAPAAEEAVAAQ